MNGNEVKTDKISMIQTKNPNYYIAVDKNDIYTIVDANGNKKIDDNYTYIEYLPGNYFIVAKDGKNGIIDSTGKVVVDFKYTSIFRFNDTNLLQAEVSQNNTIELFNFDMQKVASMEKAIIKQYNENGKKYILLAQEENFRYYDENGNELDAKTIFPNHRLFAKKIEDKWGFVDLSENIEVKAEYDMVTEFNEYGFAGIKQNGKWGVINQNGEIIQEPIYKINWINPSFLGKYYRINSWYSDSRYSSDAVYNEESQTQE